MVILGGALMPAAPVRPREDVGHTLVHGQDQPPQEPAKFRSAQREGRPRPALNAARLLLSWGDGKFFLKTSTAMVPTRRTVGNANDHMAMVIWRYHPVQLHTSS
jgi:hypothetical protein